MMLPTRIEIDDQSRVSQCRRRAKALARSLGFSEVDRERVGIAVSEAVSNVLRHAGSGVFLAQPSRLFAEPCLTVLLWDRGPGISNLDRSLEDGYSSADGQGIGLGAMKRQSDGFELYSKPKGGLVVSMRFRKRGPMKRSASPDVSYRNVFATAIPMPEEADSGDAWAVEKRSGVWKLLLVDGLGHGTKAAKAARLAVERFGTVADLAGESIMYSLNDALKGSRGAVAAVAEIDESRGRLRFTGVGNIFGRLFTNGALSTMTSSSGIVGYQMRTVSSYEFDWNKDSMIILHSDGIGSKWLLDSYPGLAFSESSIAAGVLLSDFRKQSDDSSILVFAPRGQTDREAEL
ncbi:ATP-binding protein [Pelagicoccus sp. SDUM812003]|uniref:ATP-binding protein n=1 Tax=Pelagicoccus sp. SDUM812003 TaxID=3041267 RepID=UPI00280E2955|nr:ATP-binding protein [Pelagicoccus sp. SDUM812003]MDQ8203990.1 ATP-binding protein [Pelagicoccus sp. SDUM812003]